MAAGAPEIYGTFDLVGKSNAATGNVINTSGALYKADWAVAKRVTSGGQDYWQETALCFSAKRYNSIYGAQSTIIPKSVKVGFYIKY